MPRSSPGSVVVPVFGCRLGTLPGVAPDFVMSAIDAPGVGVEAGGAGHRLYVPMGAVIGNAVLCRFPPPATFEPLCGRREFLGWFRLRGRNLRRYFGRGVPAGFEIVAIHIKDCAIWATAPQPP
jgi:hypothetical protein